MSGYIRIRRDLVPTYGHLPWSALKAAADQHLEGVEHRAPALNMLNWAEPSDTHSPMYTQFHDEVNHAFFREGDTHSWGPDKAILYQQNWARFTPESFGGGRHAS